MLRERFVSEAGESRCRQSVARICLALHQSKGDNYCYLPLYVFCGRHLLAAKLRPANIDASAGSVEEMARIVARIRQRWPKSLPSRKRG